MLRGLLRVVLVIVILVAAGAFFFGYWSTARSRPDNTAADRPVGTVGERTATAAERGRERGAELGERAGRAADEARETLTDAALTAKIKSKMALDDVVRARKIDVDTANGVVTLRGSVQSAAERERAVRLARETEGVVSVTDRLEVQ